MMLLPTCLVLLMVAVLVGMILCIGYDIAQHDQRIAAIEELQRIQAQMLATIEVLRQQLEARERRAAADREEALR